ncbi:alpha-2-HS-glycoprotein-like [Eleutherodactylus coqui]|uniref:alpha-2-HS-glycoprotein-like n=1 Tax=Eleutherodactylus coqui TaxID=57060 RepID=UPI003462A65B
MKLLIVLALLPLCRSAVLPLPQPSRVVNCDDAEAHEAANAAVQYMNSNRKTGYKFALNRIEDIFVHGSAPVEVFTVELDLLETKCPSLSPTPIEQCPVRPVVERAVEGDCDIKLKKDNGTFTVIGIRCKSELDSVENMLKFCPNCQLAPLNDTQVVHAVDVSLHKFNTGNNTAFYLLHEIGRGKIQSGISNSVDVEFVIAASNCSIDDANSGAACVENSGAGAHFGACSGSVVKNQAAADEDVVVQCAVYETQPGNVEQAVVPHVPLAPPQTNVVKSHFHHNLHYSSLGPLSSESNSAEQLAAQGSHAVKRSLTGQSVPPSAPRLHLCPGRKIHY